MTATLATTVATFRASPGGRYNEKDVQVIGPELARLAVANGEGFTAEEVVEAARPESAPLHRYFEWRDSVAAELFRTEQARGMVRSVQVKIEVREGPVAVDAWVRQFHHVSAQGEPEEAPQPRYVPVEAVRTKQDYSDQVVEAAAKELRGWRDRYAIYRHLAPMQATFAPIFEAIDNLANVAD